MNDQANERILAAGIRRHLDEGAEHLPYRVTERLAMARAKALAQVLAPAPGKPAGPSPAASATTARPAPGQARASLRWRVALALVPIAVLACGVLLVDFVQQEAAVTELAEIDDALLTDDVPLAAYADRGFGVYIKNTRR